MSHSKRLSILALVVSLLATMLVGWAGTGVASAADPARIDLKVLLVTDSTESETYGAWTALLNREGVPYATFNSAGTLTVGYLQSGTHAFYEAVVCATSCEALLDRTELGILNAYQASFGIRRVNAYAWPSPSLGMNWPSSSGEIGGAEYQLTAAGKATFGYLNGPVFVDTLTWGALATPLAGEPFESLLEGPAGSTLIGTHQNESGFEEMVVTFTANQNQLHALLLGHGQLSWVTRGVYLGYNRNYFAAQVDDVFLSDDRWDMASDTTPEDNGATVPLIRMVPSDVRRAQAWSVSNGIRLDLVFNGYGSMEAVDPNWDPGTLPVPDPLQDPLTVALLPAKSSFGWINHTFAHLDLNSVSAATIVGDIQANIDFAAAYGIGITRTELVTGGHSGLTNSNMPAALVSTGIGWIAADSSLKTPVDYWFQRPIGSSALTVPRYPSSVYYNVGTKAELIDEYRHIQALDGMSDGAVWDQLIASEININLPHILKNDPRPHFIHQSNLAEEGTFYLVLDAVLARYHSYFADGLLVQPSLAEAGRILRRTAAWAGAQSGVTAYYQQGKLYLSSTTTVDAPVTGLPESMGESYGGERSDWVSIGSTPTVIDIGGQSWDPTLPFITPTVTGTAGSDGWYRSDVTVTWAVSDPESAVTSTTGCGPTVVAFETAGSIVTCSATSAGGTNSQSVTVKVDKTAPTVVYSGVSSLPNVAGWYQADVTATFTASDGLSGFAGGPTETATAITSGEGATVTVGSPAFTDLAGNIATAGVAVSPEFQIDKTAPSGSWDTQTHAANANGWYNQSFTVTWTSPNAGTDLSDNVTCGSPVTYSGPDTGTGVVSGQCTDAAGNVGTGTFNFKYDATAPTVVYSSVSSVPNAAGWYQADVTATFTASDGLSGFAGGATETATATTSGEGAAVTVGSPAFTDLAGNIAAAGVAVSPEFQIDKTAPSVVGTPSRAANANGWYNQSFTVTWTSPNAGTDLSDNVTCGAPATYSGPDTGTGVLSGQCTDAAGNVGTGTFNFKYDATAPTIEAERAPDPGVSGWFNAATGAPTITFTCADLGGSGVDACPNPVTFGNGENQPWSGTVFDKAGNSASVNGTDVNVDLIAPAVGTHPDMPVEATGPSGATVTFVNPSAIDVNLVGGVTCLPASGSAFPIGATTVTCSAADRAGNVGQSTFRVIVGDNTAPEISYATTPSAPDGANGWFRSDVTLTWTVTESESPSSLVKVGCLDGIISADQSATTYSCSATSNGGSATAVEVTIKRDTQAPLVADLGVAAGSPGLNGWYTSAVTEGFSAGDAISGLADCSAYFTKTSATEGTAVVISSGSCSDNAGNTNPGVNSPGYKIDVTAPVVATRSNIAVDAIDATTAAVTFTPPSATDTNPLAPAVSCSPSSGSLFSAGDTVVTCRATDAAGNEGHSHFTITVTAVAGPDPAVVAIDSEPLKIGRTDYMAVLFDDGTVETRRVSDGTLRSSVVFPEVAPVALAVLPDTRGAPDLAVLGLTSGGAIRVYVRDSVTGALVSRAVFGIEYSEDMDLEASGTNLVVLGTRPSDGAVRVQTRTRAGTLVGTANFGTVYSGTDLELIGNYVAVLGTRASDGAVRVQVRYRSGSLSGTASFGKAYSGDDLEIISGRLAVLGTRASDGAVRVQIRYRGGSLSGTASFGTASSGDHLSVVAGRVAVLGTRRADGAIQVQVRTTAGTLKGTGIYGADFSADDLEVIGANLAVLGTRTSDGATRVEVRTTSGAAYRTVMYD